MNDNLYLILHKVRGEPAFDIASRCDDMGTSVDPGPWWIIPTSGHRAYPYTNPVAGVAAIALNDLKEIGTGWLIINDWSPWIKQVMIDLSPDWPDHYPDRPSPAAPRLLTGLLSTLGLRKKPELKRRKF